jgi:hypothetical protein
MKSLHAKPQHYDIVRKDPDQYALWLESAPDLNAAESRMEEFTSFWPGEFQVVDQQTHQIVAKSTDPPHYIQKHR